jgi:hypothetical protein
MELTKICCDCKEPKLVEQDFYFLSRKTGKRHARCKSCQNIHVRNWLRAIKLEAVAEYGGRCVCCGESAPQFLTIDHVNGGGLAHRKQMKCASIWYFLKKNNYPKDGYQLLCFNCNCARGSFGYCHQKEITQL